MQYEEWKKAVEAGAFFPLLLLYGEEEYHKDEALALLRARLLDGPMGELSLHQFDSGAGEDEYLAACETMALFGGKTVVVVRDCALLKNTKAPKDTEKPKDDDAPKGADAPEDTGKAVSKRLQAYIEHPNEQTCLVFLMRDAVDKRNALFKMLVKKGALVECAPLTDTALARWLMEEVRGRGKALAAADAQEMVALCGKELSALRHELEKLCDYVGERERIRAEDIRRIVTRSLEYTVFQLVDAVVAKQADRAITLLGEMLGTGEKPLGILALLARQFRILTFYQQMQQEKATRQQMESVLGVSKFVLDKLRTQARRFPRDASAHAMELCLEADWAFKSGKQRDARLMVEKVVLSLCL